MHTATIERQLKRRQDHPGPYQTQCPSCGCRWVVLTAEGRHSTVLHEYYLCDQCGEEYRLQYHLVSRKRVQRRGQS